METHHESWLRVHDAARAYDEALGSRSLADPHVSALRRAYIVALTDFRLHLITESRRLPFRLHIADELSDRE